MTQGTWQFSWDNAFGISSCRNTRAPRPVARPFTYRIIGLCIVPLHYRLCTTPQLHPSSRLSQPTHDILRKEYVKHPPSIHGSCRLRGKGLFHLGHHPIHFISSLSKCSIRALIAPTHYGIESASSHTSVLIWVLVHDDWLIGWCFCYLCDADVLVFFYSYWLLPPKILLRLQTNRILRPRMCTLSCTCQTKTGVHLSLLRSIKWAVYRRYKREERLQAQRINWECFRP